MPINHDGGLVAAIHQPNFLPWLGYFDKIARADRFIFMDNVQFPRTSRGTWTNRVRLAVNGSPRWATCPVRRTGGVQLIQDVLIDDSDPWREKLLKTIRHSYGKTPWFEALYPFFRELIELDTTKLTELNINAVIRISALLGIGDKFILGSSLEASGQATELLIHMTKAAGCQTYLCGGGAGGYQKDDAFVTARVGLVYQNFVHPRHSQAGSGEFIEGLSILDALFNIGTQELKRALNL